MEPLRTDICVIGAGSAGLSVAAGAVQMGARVVLIEGHKMGGDCLNYGCIPSKALLAAARRAYARTADTEGGPASADEDAAFAKASDHVRQVISSIAPHDSQERFEGLGVRVIREYARFISPREVEAGGLRIRARRFVIATGSRPFVPPIDGLGSVPYDTNETIFEVTERPGHLIVIGAGPIGLEMAQAHRRLGSDVTVIEAARALGQDDPETAAVVIGRLRAEGIRIIEGDGAKRVSGRGGAIGVETAAGLRIEGTRLLVAVGRQANIERLDLDKAGVRYGRAVEVGDDLRSSNRRVYAIGDAAGRLQFTHAAGYHASVVLRPLLFGLKARARQDHIPWATYTDPELAQIGLTEARAREKYGARLRVARFEYGENDRAIAEGQTAGLIKVMVVGGRPVGASIAGSQAGELIAFWSLAIANNMRMEALARMVAPYPTLAELNKRVVGAYFSPKLFDNPAVKRVVGMVQRWLP